MYLENIIDIRRLLFENQSVRQTIFKNTFWLACAEGITKLVNLVFLIYIARILGATQYGVFSFALAFTGLFSAFLSFGLPRIIVREFSQDSSREKDFSSILSLKILLGVLTFSAIVLGSWFITPDAQTQKIIWILAVYTVIDNFIVFLNFFFQARQHMEYEAFFKIFRVLLIAGIGMLVLSQYPSVEQLSLAYLGASGITFFVLFNFFRMKVFRVRFSWDITIWRRYLRVSWPLALAGFLGTLQGQIDSVLLGFLNFITETGWYNAAYRIAGGAAIPLGLLTTSFYPVLARAHSESRERFQRAWDIQVSSMLFLAVPIVVGGIAVASPLIYAMYDLSFTPSIFVFKILIGMVGVSLLQNPFSQALLVFGDEKKFILLSGAGAVASIGLNSILIPRYTLYGAAVSAFATASILLFLYVIFASRSTHVKIFQPRFFIVGITSLICSFIMRGFLTFPLIENLHVFILIVGGAIVYFVSLAGFRLVFKRLFKFDLLNL